MDKLQVMVLTYKNDLILRGKIYKKQQQTWI